jgi:hypothetical protein
MALNKTEAAQLKAAVKTVSTLTTKALKPAPAPKKPTPKTAVKKAAAVTPKATKKK